MLSSHALSLWGSLSEQSHSDPRKTFGKGKEAGISENSSDSLDPEAKLVWVLLMPGLETVREPPYIPL